MSEHTGKTTVDRVPMLLCRTLALALLTVVLSGCTRASEEPSIGRRWIDALNTRDPSKALALLAPTATFTDPVTREPLAIPAYRTRLQLDWMAWKDRVYLAQRIMLAGDRIIIEWQIRQTHSSGEVVPVDGVTVLDTQNGRITAVRDYYDLGLYLRFFRPTQAK